MNIAIQNAVDIVTMEQTYHIYSYTDTFERLWINPIKHALERTEVMIRMTETSGTFAYIPEEHKREREQLIAALNFYENHKHLLRGMDD